MINELLKKTINECGNPDLRDRAFIYQRLLLKDPMLTKKVVFAERPEISDQAYIIENDLLNKLIENIGTLASVYYKPPE